MSHLLLQVGLVAKEDAEDGDADELQQLAESLSVQQAATAAATFSKGDKVQARMP